METSKLFRVLTKDESAKLDSLRKPDENFTNFRVEPVKTLLDVHHPGRLVREVES